MYELAIKVFFDTLQLALLYPISNCTHIQISTKSFVWYLLQNIKYCMYYLLEPSSL